MASPMPDHVTIEIGEYANLLMIQQAADYVYGLIHDAASTPDDIEMVSAQTFARNLLDEWTK